MNKKIDKNINYSKEEFYDLHEILKLMKYKYKSEDYSFFVRHYVKLCPELLMDAVKYGILGESFFMGAYEYIDYLDYKHIKEIDYYIKDSFYNFYLRKKLCVNNYDLDNLTYNDYELYFDINKHNIDKVINILKEIKERNINRKIVLRMYRVDKYIINKVRNIVPNLYIAPIYNQENSNRSFGTYYEIEEIFKLDKTFDIIADSVRDKIIDNEVRTLSPFEKYLACYLITIRLFKYYKDKNTSSFFSKSVYEIIKEDSQEIVCTGYAYFLIELLNRVGLHDVVRWGVRTRPTFWDVDTHTRILIYMNDPKYNLDGVFMGDPTWDSINESRDDYKLDHVLLNGFDLLMKEGFDLDMVHILDKKLLNKLKIKGKNGNDKIDFILKHLFKEYDPNIIEEALNNIKEFCYIDDIKDRKIRIKKK